MMLLDYALFNEIANPKPHAAISACTADLEPSTSNEGFSDSNSNSNPDSETRAMCVAKEAKQTKATSSVQLVSSGASSSARVADVAVTLDQLLTFSLLFDSAACCNDTIKYAYSGEMAVAPSENGCISNCGTDIIVSDAPRESI
jgi:hypothetical protein